MKLCILKGVLIFLLASLFFSPLQRVFAQTAESNMVCTRVGDNAPECKTGQTPPSEASVSCPLKGRREINCGSFMSDPKFNTGICVGSEPIDRGHCGRTYDRNVGGGCYTGNIETTRVKRWAQSIDITAPRGETVYAPHINGQVVRWRYVVGASYSIEERFGGGWGHAFVTTVGTEKWIMYTVHSNSAIISAPVDNNGYYESGDPIATIYRDHLHFNIGKEIEDNRYGWISPESLGICVF